MVFLDEVIIIVTVKLESLDWWGWCDLGEVVSWRWGWTAWTPLFAAHPSQYTERGYATLVCSGP